MGKRLIDSLKTEDSWMLNKQIKKLSISLFIRGTKIKHHYIAIQVT